MQELLNNLGINGKLLLAQAVNFLLVLWLLNRFVFKRLLAFLEERKERIQKGIELSDRATKEMERVREARGRELERTRGEVTEILSEARASALQKEKELQVAAKEKAGEIVHRAHTQGERERADAVLRAKEDIKIMTVRATEKILGRSVNDKDNEKMLDEVLEYLDKEYAK